MGAIVRPVGPISDDGPFRDGWRAYEIKRWVKLAREQGFDLHGLEDRDLRMACFVELQRQEMVEGKRAMEPPKKR